MEYKVCTYSFKWYLVIVFYRNFILSKYTTTVNTNHIILVSILLSTLSSAAVAECWKVAKL